MNKEKEAFSFLNETRFELLRKLVIKIINGYEIKWKKDRDNNYVKTNARNRGTGRKKLSKLLPKNESYILNCLEIHWRRIEDKLESLDLDFQPNTETKLFGILRKIDEQLTTCGHSELAIDEVSCLNKHCREEIFQTELGLREEDFQLNIQLNESEAYSVSHSLCNAPDVLNSLTNFYIFVNCDMNDEKLTNQLNNICSVDFLFHTKNFPQMNKSKPLSLELSPFNENSTNLKVVDKSFKDLDNIDTLNITSPTAIPLHNNQICYINFSKVWKESRWSTVKQRLIQRGVMEANGMYVVFPIYRKEFIIGKGSFGPVEFGLSRNYHGIALKRLTENGFCTNRLEEVLSRFSDLTCENLHKTIAFQDMAGYAFLSSRICEYNLAEYISLVKNNINEWNGERKVSVFLQIIKGLTALHLNDPIIVHGNLKPTNVLIDENGVVKLAEFGLFSVSVLKFLFLSKKVKY